MLFGLVLYVVYRRSTGKSLLRRVTVPKEALLGDHHGAEYGSILVPIFGSTLDDDIIQTAGRLAAEEEFDTGEGPTIEAIWVFEVPMSLPIDARLPDGELARARTALARAKAVGEEYENVEVATATVRARRAGQAIVDEAKRRGRAGDRPRRRGALEDPRRRAAGRARAARRTTSARRRRRSSPRPLHGDPHRASDGRPGGLGGHRAAPGGH